MYPKFEKDDSGKDVVIIEKKDYEDFQSQFQNGFNKGRYKGRKDAMDLFSFLDLDVEEFVKDGKPEKVKAALSDAEQQLKDLKDGKLPKEVLEKISDKEGVIKDLQTKLEEKSRALEKAESDHQNFKHTTLIDGEINRLAARHKAIDAADTIGSFRRAYKAELDEHNRVVVRNTDGSPVTDGKGNDLGIEAVFERFKDTKKHLFEGNGRAGSGGGPDGGDGTSKVMDMSDEEFEKTAEAVRAGKQVKLE